jgi:hypothetical protein
MDGTADGRGPRLDSDVPTPGSDAPGLFTLSPDTGNTIDEGLAAILESIRSWDWRSDIAVEPTVGMVHVPVEGPPIASLLGQWSVEPPTTSLPVLAEDKAPSPTVGPYELLDVESEPMLPPRAHLLDERSSIASYTTAPEVEAPAQFSGPYELADFERGQPPESDPPAGASEIDRPSLFTDCWQAHATDVVTVEPTADPDDSDPSEVEPATDAGSARRRIVKLVLWIIAAVLVITIVTVIRFTALSSPGTLTPTKVKPRGSAIPAAIIPVTSSVKASFASTSKLLDAANVTVTQSLASSNGQPVAQVAQEIRPYVTALNTFVFRTHFLAWPESMLVPSEDLTLRTKSLVSFLASISSASPATLDSWFTQLHAFATMTQTADNLVRKDIGLSPTSSYPT